MHDAFFNLNYSSNTNLNLLNYNCAYLKKLIK